MKKELTFQKHEDLQEFRNRFGYDNKKLITPSKTLIDDFTTEEIEVAIKEFSASVNDAAE
jgi:hypothetical protein